MLTVSIITVSYNSENTIIDTIESVINQDYPFIEYIIVDGNSKDGTMNIIGGYGSKIQRVISEPDKGIYDAMNKGLQLASGDIVGILNSDDYYVDNTVISNVAACFEVAAVDAMYSDLLYVNTKKGVERVVRYWKSGMYNRNRFLFGWMPPHPTFFVRRSVYKSYGDFNLTLKSAADYEIMLRFLYKHSISCTYLPKVTIKMRTGGVSNASLNNRIRANREDRKAWQINNIRPYFFTLFFKPLLKISQYFSK